MTRFRVWAPFAHRVELAIRGQNLPTRGDADGWYCVEDAQARPGDRYGYRLDGGAPLPDPRSESQPDGVHGLSELVDHSAFAWSDGGWHGAPLASAVLYEMHVGTFTAGGTFDSAITRLGELADLGVTAVEVMPVAEFPGRRGWGYDGVDLYAPHHAYGGPNGLKRFVDACHAHGLAVVMDAVYNHLGPDGNHLPRFGPYFGDRYRTLWGEALNFDGPDSGPVRQFVVDNALTWLRDYHCDGLRLDAVHAIVDTSAIHILEELAAAVRALEASSGRTLWVIAETDLNDPRPVRPVEAGGFGLTAQWSDDFHHALHAALTGERNGYYGDFSGLGDVAKSLCDVFVIDGRYSPQRRRVHGRPAPGLPGSRFLGYLQNHDQVGNRALGERSSALMSPGRLRIGAALVLTAPFVPMLFMGEEWGTSSPFLYFTDHRDPILAHAVSRGRREEFASFGWPEDSIPDPQDAQTFLRSKLDWEERHTEPHRALLDWYRRLVALRRSHPSLTDPRRDAVHAQADASNGVLVMRRGRIGVACHIGEGTVRVDTGASPGMRTLLSWPEGVDAAGGGVELPEDSVVIWEECG